jgi:hypothetical protein
MHASKFEAEHCNKLLALQQAGEVEWFKIQQPFALVVNHQPICVHIVDFVVKYKNKDKREAQETKGFRTQAWVIKRKLFLACWGDYYDYITIERSKKCQKRTSLIRTPRFMK